MICILSIITLQNEEVTYDTGWTTTQLCQWDLETLTREVALYTGTKVISDGLHPGWFERFEPSFALALDAFIAALEGKETPYPSLMDGLCAQIIAEAAVESLHRNQPVKITYWQPE